MLSGHTNVLITGVSKGIGLSTAELFLSMNPTLDYNVIGIDVEDCPSTLKFNKYYTHHICDVRGELPDIENVHILINNAGVQNSGSDIDINLKGTINCTEKYGLQPDIKAIVNVASVSAHNGAEFPEYCASKGGMLAYTVNTAKRVAKFYATCNSISPGGVLTELNAPVMNDYNKWSAIMNETPLQKWASSKEIAQWIYFVSVINNSMTGQDIIIDNGEMINHKFIW